MRPKVFNVYHYNRETRLALLMAEVKASSTAAALLSYWESKGIHENQEQRQYYARLKPRMSGEQAHVLNLARRQGTNIHWVPLVDGKGSQSRTVGRGATIEACQRHGWLNGECLLTQAGREAIAAYNEKNGID
jgi:primosomal replication protein N